MSLLTKSAIHRRQQHDNQNLTHRNAGSVPSPALVLIGANCAAQIGRNSSRFLARLSSFEEGIKSACPLDARSLFDPVVTRAAENSRTNRSSSRLSAPFCPLAISLSAYRSVG